MRAGHWDVDISHLELGNFTGPEAATRGQSEHRQVQAGIDFRRKSANTWPCSRRVRILVGSAPVRVGWQGIVLRTLRSRTTIKYRIGIAAFG